MNVGNYHRTIYVVDMLLEMNGRNYLHNINLHALTVFSNLEHNSYFNLLKRHLRKCGDVKHLAFHIQSS